MPALDVDDLHEVGAQLRGLGYDEPSLAAALGLPRFPAFRSSDIAIYERRLEDRGPLATLARLFLLGQPVPRTAVEAVFPTSGMTSLETHGLVALKVDAVRPLARITPHAGLLFAHDADNDGVPESDHVLGIGPASRALHHLTIRPVVEQALDIGTGCGVQALSLARHAERVIATDVNPRALRYTKINAALNGIDNVEVREGSLLEPVVGETFDLVVANLPFVLSPDDAFVFRDAGQIGNVSQALVSRVDEVLRTGGTAQVLISWEITGDSDPEGEPFTWIANADCDAWLLAAPVEDGLTYAAKWNAWLRAADPSRYVAALDRWAAFYAQHRITALGTGTFVLRRRDAGVPWRRTDRIVSEPGRRGGEQVQRVLTAQDWLQALPADELLLTMTPRFVDDHRLDQTLRYRGGSYVVDDVRMQLEDGAGVSCALEPQALLVLLAVDGHHALGQLIDEASEGLTDDEAGTLFQVTTSTVRQLVALGMMVLDEPDEFERSDGGEYSAPPPGCVDRARHHGHPADSGARCL